MSQRSAHLAELASMGFSPAASQRALQETNNSIHRAIDWLLSHPDEAAAAESDSREPSPPPTRPAAASAQAFLQHSGEYRRTSARPAVRVGLDGIIIACIEHYCSSEQRPEGTRCMHSGVIQSDHWSCKCLPSSHRHHLPCPSATFHRVYQRSPAAR
jgi:hypothetical protein